MGAYRFGAVMILTTRHILPTVLLAVTLITAGCFVSQRTQPMAPAQKNAQANPSERYRTRPPINTNSNLYEGGLWRGAASWGNLLRDHRARYRGDLLTVTDLAEIIKVPEPKPEKPAEAAPAGEVEKPKEDPIVAFLRAQQKQREAVDREQNEILRSIQSVEVEVVRVLANGNLMVRGAHPPVYRDQGRIKYIITLKGIVRPSDVDDKNTIKSAKLSKAEYQIRRFVKRGSVAGAARAARNSTRNRFANFLSGK